MPLNPPWVMNSSLLTLQGMGASLETVFPMGSPPLGAAFTPSSLTGLIGWYDASQITGVSSGASLSVWTDLSGNGNHATQPSAASQPVYLANQQNGLSVVSMIGTIGSASPNLASYMTAGFTLLQPATKIAAFAFKSAVTSQQRITGGVGSCILGLVTSNNFQAFATTAVDSLFTMDTNWHTGGGVFSGSSSTVFIASKVSFGATGNANPNGISLFGDINGVRGAGIHLGEVVQYNRILTTDEISQLTTYLNSKWSAF